MCLSASLPPYLLCSPCPCLPCPFVPPLLAPPPLLHPFGPPSPSPTRLHPPSTQPPPHTHTCSDTRTRFLGTKPPKLFAAAVRGERSMLALSSRPWLGYSDQGKFNLVPMSYEALDYAAGGCR